MAYIGSSQAVTQDFAKIRPEPIVERKPPPPAPGWSFMLTGILVGITIGVSACVLLYVSGLVPPLPSNQPVLAAEILEAEPEPQQAAEDEALELEFYYELPNYEVAVEASPVELTPEQSGESVPVNYMLQSGAFTFLESAEREVARQQALGLDVYMGTSNNGLYVVQSGPYLESLALNRAEQILRRNNIAGQRMSPR